MYAPPLKKSFIPRAHAEAAPADAAGVAHPMMSRAAPPGRIPVAAGANP